MFIKICIERLRWNHCRDNKFVLNAIYSLNLGLWTLLKIPSKHPLQQFFTKIIMQGSQRSVKSIKSGNYEGIWKVPSFLQKTRELSGNLGLHQGFSIAFREFSGRNLPRLCLSVTRGNVLQILAGYGSHSPWISLGNVFFLKSLSLWIFLNLLVSRGN